MLFSFQLLVAEKRALIVAIGKYPVASGWTFIRSVIDVSLFKLSLQKQGFNPQNITSITNEKATKSGMLNEFNKLIISQYHTKVLLDELSKIRTELH